MDRQPFVCTLSAAETYRLGEPILVAFQITNTGTATYQVLDWGTPLENEVTDFLAVQRDGREVAYDGRLVKRGDPADADYVLLGPGRALSREVDISLSYPVDQPGDYTATLKITLHDAFAVPGSSKQPPRRRDDHQPHRLDPTVVRFKVIADGQPRQTVGQAARQAEDQAKTSAKAATPNFNGGTSAQQADTIVAHDNAQYFTALCAQQLLTTNASTNALYQKWFGAFDQGRYDTVTKHYTDISNVLDNDPVTYDLTGDGCANLYGYTTKGTRTVHLCSFYLSAAQIGTDCKFGTLVHEWSHAVSSTDDNAYGQTACRNLATSDPAKAIDNADSHEYFAEELAQSSFGKTCQLIVDRDTFGLDEIDVLLPHGPAIFPNAFYVFVDGFWPDKLGITAASLSGAPNVKPTITVEPTVPGTNVSAIKVTVTALEAEDSSLPVSPQRFTWLCQLEFTDDTGFPVTPGQVNGVTLTAAIAGLSASAQIELIHEPNPYEMDGETWWLSTDLRVFQIRAGETRFGAAMGSTPADASTFIQQVLSNLNAGSSGGQTFDSISVDPQVSTLELAQQVNGTNVFNFAIAKVRYRGTLDVANVRVFFRLFQASTTSAEFNPATTYRRATQGTTAIPLLGLDQSGDVVSIPCFAEARVNSASASIAAQQDPTNVRTLAHDPGGSEVPAYFGCWLDINQTQRQFPPVPSPSDGPWAAGRQTVQQLVRGAHQCLVAEIAFDPDPIPSGASPGGSDKLAQRNLAIVESANPGDSASRRIPNTFAIHPIGGPGRRIETPDELLIDWGGTPDGSVATLYIPEVDAEQIIALANRRHAIRPLGKVDAETLRFPASGLTYLPLPPGAAFGLTGLLAVDLPDTVRKGEVYTIVVRQLTDAMVEPPIEIQRTSSRPAASMRGLLRWRQVVGSYQITIPVRTKERILTRETRLLAVLKWILESLSPHDRWFPVFSRYVGMIADRVGALGGDPEDVVPSPTGAGGGSHHGHGRTLAFDGKVAGVVYDCFGDFEGFLLDGCDVEVRFDAREPEIERLVRTAWRERIALTVTARPSTPHRPTSIILRRAPARCD
jgi:Lysine-specific metallo-endopeptidase